MPAPELALLKQPIAIREEYIARAPTTLRIKQLDISGIDFAISREDSDSQPGSSKSPKEETLFTADGKFMSWSQKRTFRDASGLPLIDLYRKTSGVTWYAELPGTKSATPILRFASRVAFCKHKIDVDFKNATPDGSRIRLEVRGQDIWKLRTNVYLGNAVVMTVKRTDKMKVYLPGLKLEWVVDVAEGMDLLLGSTKPLTMRL